MRVRLIFWVVIGVLLAMYVYQYYRYPDGSGILQTDLENFTFDMLLERQPIFVHSTVADVQGLMKAWFGRALPPAKQLFGAAKKGDWVRNSYKHCLVYNPNADGPAELLLAPPHKTPDPEDGSVTALRIPPNCVVILPFRWHIASASLVDGRVHVFGHHDWITWLLPAA